MADAPPVEAHDAPPLTPREHLDVIHDHVHHVMDAMDGAHAEPDADEESAEGDTRPDSPAEESGEPRGMDTRPPWQRTADAIAANPQTAKTLAAALGRRARP
jgi:hypothetical protein